MRSRRWVRVGAAAAGALAVLVVLMVLEARTSWLQARLLADFAEEIGFVPGEGPSPRTLPPGSGPSDVRRGYARLPDLVPRLEERGFRVTEQAVPSPRLVDVVEYGLFPIYPEKTRAGLVVTGRGGRLLHESRFPERTYPAFDSIPDLVVRTLLFIENRELLDAGTPHRNPAVEWDRLARSVGDVALRVLGAERSVPGASTLATQMEKFRHSPEGITAAPSEKLRQMASASLRAYLEGPRTLDARRRIVLDYVNSVPLAAIPGYGEVLGLGDGLWTWHGIEFEEANRLLRSTGDGASGGAVSAEAARVYRAVLGLVLAQRRPSHYLGRPAGRAELDRLTDIHLELLVRGGVISAGLGDAVREVRAPPRLRSPETTPLPFVERKAANAVRTHLLGLLGVERLYELDRLDLDVRSTVDPAVQEDVVRSLQRLGDPEFVRSTGLDAFRLLQAGDPSRVVYSVVLYERRPEGNVVRVQADNFPGPFDLNEASRMELGSTAKLRTLVTYLEVAEELHRRLAGSAPEVLASEVERHPDPLTRWAAGMLRGRPDLPLREFLEAAMDRRYSARPDERFFTGGGTHVFQNFDRTYDGAVLPVREAFRHSVNLVFVRLMRDIVRYHTVRLTGASARILEDPEDTTRRAYLERFADREGRQFMGRFHRKYAGKSDSVALDLLVSGRRLPPQRMAWAFRSVRPEAGVEAFAAFLRRHSPESVFTERAIADFYRRADPSGLSWQDRGYLARVHPLELWVAAYLRDHPQAGPEEVLAAGAEVRQEVYRWLFRPGRRAAQDQRIRTMLEVEAFLEIQRRWARTGYPFQNLVPSFGTAIGSSGDRPGALAELVGILLSDGMRRPVFRVEELRFAEGTPWEVALRRAPAAGERVLSAQVAAVARTALRDVVERGTARSVAGVFRDGDGAELPLGGKTGTGNNQYKVFGAGGRLVEAVTVNRTATFVFAIGDRWFGVVTAHVPGPAAAGYRFTSALPVRILALLAPEFESLLRDGEGEDGPPSPGEG